MAFGGCTADPKTVDNYINNPDNGLCSEIEVNNSVLKVLYMPDKLVASEIISSKIDSFEKTQIIKNCSENIYLKLSLSTDGSEVLNKTDYGAQWYNDILEKLNFRLGEFIIAKDSNHDTLELIDYSYPRLYGMSSTTDVLLAFRKHNTTYDWIDIEIKEFGLNIGARTVRIHCKDIESIPQIKIE